MMHIIAITNRKGGTGKTTVSVNLAAELARAGLRVLLIDLDSQGHCAIGLGVRVAATDKSVHDIFVDPSATLSAAIRDTSIANLSLVPANPRFDHGTGERDDSRLKRAVTDEALAKRFDVMVIDTPPSLDMLLVNALMAATRVIVPYVPHHLSLEGVRQLVRILFRVMTRENRALKILGFLPTMQAEHIREHRTIKELVSREFGSLRVLAGIRVDIRLAESFSAGQPICLYSPNSRGAQDFDALARDVDKHLTEFQ